MDNPASRLLKLLSAPMRDVDAIVLDKMQSDIPLIPQIGKHIINSGGKRVRPLLTLAAAQLGQAPDLSNASMLAAAVEFIHTATLLHDDVVDKSDLRRGTRTANTIWGNKASILVGDFLFSRAFELMVAVNDFNVLKILSGASAKIAEGEVHQLKTTNDLSTTQEAYEAVIGAKTAALFEAAMHVGALVSPLETCDVAALAKYGYYLGLAFQMVDDALDFSASAQDMGKEAGDDFREGKVTLPIIFAYKTSGWEERAFWERTIGKLNQDDSDLEQACHYLKACGAIEETLRLAKQRGTEAMATLSRFEDGNIKTQLIDLINFVVHRRH